MISCNHSSGATLRVALTTFDDAVVDAFAFQISSANARKALAIKRLTGGADQRSTEVIASKWLRKLDAHQI
jgi:hypothetical protein